MSKISKKRFKSYHPPKHMSVEEYGKLHHDKKATFIDHTFNKHKYSEVCANCGKDMGSHFGCKYAWCEVNNPET